MFSYYHKCHLMYSHRTGLYYMSKYGLPYIEHTFSRSNSKLKTDQHEQRITTENKNVCVAEQQLVVAAVWKEKKHWCWMLSAMQHEKMFEGSIIYIQIRYDSKKCWGNSRLINFNIAHQEFLENHLKSSFMILKIFYEYPHQWVCVFAKNRGKKI